MTANDEPQSPFLRALGVARELGRADGRLAAGFEPPGEPAPIGPRCHGLVPEDLARLVWDAGEGPVPAGLALNAPLWYAQGFREALAGAGAALPRPRPGAEVPGGDRRPRHGRGTRPAEPVRPPAPRRPEPTGRPADGGGEGVPGAPGVPAGRAVGTTAPPGGGHRLAPDGEPVTGPPGRETVPPPHLRRGAPPTSSPALTDSEPGGHGGDRHLLRP